jgi:hypothetical protein
VPLHTHTVPAPRLTRAASLSGSNHNESVLVRDGANLAGTNHNETVVVRRTASSGR